MTASRRQSMLIGVMLLMLAVAAGWSVNRMLTARAEAAAAAADRATARQLAEAIADLRDQPAVAATQAMGRHQLLQRITDAAERAGLSSDVVEGTYPQSPRRVGQTPYRRQPTAITLRPLPLHQLTDLLYHLTAESNLTVQDLRLRAPRDAEADENVWEAEANVTYLIYSPPADSPTGS